MADFVARYRSFVDVDAIAIGECTIHACTGGPGGAFWHMWFRVSRDTDGGEMTACVPVIPNGSFTESGPGGRSWGLQSIGAGAWHVSPSINVLASPCPSSGAQVHPGDHPTVPSLWHHTPRVYDVPDGERWMTGAP